MERIGAGDFILEGGSRLTVSWTETQVRRLKEMDASDSDLNRSFEDDDTREGDR